MFPTSESQFLVSVAKVCSNTCNAHRVIAVSTKFNKKLSYCWETVRRESMPRIAEMDVEMTT